MRPLAEFARRRAEGGSLWIDELRASLAEAGDAAELPVRLHLPFGGARDYRLPLALPQGEGELSLLRDYLRASLFNMLSACGAAEAELFLPEGLPEILEQLIRETPERLGEAGYRKPLRVSGRLCAAAGREGPRFQLRSPGEWEPLPPREGGGVPPLGPRLRETGRRGDLGLRCGLDVGGTDMKLVLSREGRLLFAEELDWDPSRLQTAEELMTPILDFVRRGLESLCPDGEARLRSIGLSFPDVVIRDRILGGETPKTQGMRGHDPEGYETQLRKLSGLKERLEELCLPGARVRALNDGSMAAFTAAMELAFAGEDEAIGKGVFAHSLGTDLGSGWLAADGAVPELPLELYDLLIDLGDGPAAALPPMDLRSTRNENSGLPGARRYLGQAAAFRLAWELDRSLLDGFARERDGLLQIAGSPEDLRKPCLEHLMLQAEAGERAAEEIFRSIGRHLGHISREICWLLSPETEERFLFGRFVRHPRCFALIREGCGEVLPSLRLTAADGELARSDLMRQLSARGEGMVARFGQAVGALYYGIEEET